MREAIDPVGNATVPAAPVVTTAAATESFTDRLADEMKRIAAHAEKSETLKNGAELYVFADGKEIEQAPGKSPYVVKKEA